MARLAPLAPLGRALPPEGKGQRVKSSWVRHLANRAANTGQRPGIGHSGLLQIIFPTADADLLMVDLDAVDGRAEMRLAERDLDEPQRAPLSVRQPCALSHLAIASMPIGPEPASQPPLQRPVCPSFA